MRDDRTFLEDMRARVELIAAFTAEGRDAFMRSRMMQEAVIRSLEVIGEASRNISHSLREAHSEIPWQQITAFRNFAIHVYWDIKMDRVWEIVVSDLPPLRAALQAILDSLPPEAVDE